MSDVATDTPKTSLGVVAVFGQAINLFIKRAPLFIILALVVGVSLNLLNYAFFGAALFVSPEEMFSTNVAIAGFISTMVVSMISTSILLALITLAAYDLHQGNQLRLGAYFSTAIRYFPAIFLLTLVATIGMTLGMMLLIVPGLYIFAMWSVMVPAIVVDRAGFSGLGRSQDLTKGYRWSILGLLILVGLLIALVNAVLGLVLGFGFAAAFDQANGISFLIFQSVIGSIGYAFYAIVVVALFARLKEIKEGVGMEDLINVFD